jgi:hypothetical protein
MVDCCNDLPLDEMTSSTDAAHTTRPLLEPTITRKRGRSNVCEYMDAYGQLHHLMPIMSNWYVLYALNPAVIRPSFQRNSVADFGYLIPSFLS